MCVYKKSMHGHYEMRLGKLGNSMNLTRPCNCVCNIIHKDNFSHMYAVLNCNKNTNSQVRNQKKELPQAFWGKSRYPMFLI